MTPKKETRGRKKVAEKDRKVMVYILVPEKHRVKAQREITPIGIKYCSL